jgi:predicted metalloprotease with PDZ domain
VRSGPLRRLLRALWADWRETGAGWTEEGLRARLCRVTGVDVQALLRDWVDGCAVQPDLDALLATHGLQVERVWADAVDLGLELDVTEAAVSVRTVLADGPNADGVLAPGDVLVAIDGREVRAGSLAALDLTRADDYGPVARRCLGPGEAALLRHALA